MTGVKHSSGLLTGPEPDYEEEKTAGQLDDERQTSIMARARSAYDEEIDETPAIERQLQHDGVIMENQHPSAKPKLEASASFATEMHQIQAAERAAREKQRQKEEAEEAKRAARREKELELKLKYAQELDPEVIAEDLKEQTFLENQKKLYPDAKPVIFSFFMSQSNLLGMYIPFSMEATYNDDMVRTNLPSTICHEYSHLKGYMQEDEANFISFVATQGSDNPEVRYSGCIDALEYVHNQIYTNEVRSGFELSEKISPQVRNDWFRFLPDNYWEENEDKEIISTETVSSVSESASDTSMKLNGVEDGSKSYGRMVDLMLNYFIDKKSDRS